jgi:hypothetical protein
MIFIRACALQGTGTLSANGLPGPDVISIDGAGGGGAGGSVLVAAGQPFAGLTVNAKGANGAGANTSSFPEHGPGGGGGGGVVFLSSAGTVNVNGGVQGHTTTVLTDYNGAQPGQAGLSVSNITLSQLPGALNCACLPNTPTNSPTPSPTSTATQSPTNSPSNTPTVTPTITVTFTPTMTFTFTATFTATPTLTPTCVTHLWPDPFNPRYAFNGTLKVGCLPAGAQVSFYTLSGEAVGPVTESGGIAQWNGNNQQGVPVSEGVYYYVIQSGTNVLGRGKFLVVR